MPARLKPSKKRRMLNMGTLTEKATLRPNASMDSTDMISIGWRPNLPAELRMTSHAGGTRRSAKLGAKALPVGEDPKDQVPEAGAHHQGELGDVDLRRRVAHQTPLWGQKSGCQLRQNYLNIGKKKNNFHNCHSFKLIIFRRECLYFKTHDVVL